MHESEHAALKELFESRDVAALGTLHHGEPFVSMTPYALLSGGRGFVVHVSQLASHTRDMLANPAVSLLVTALREPGNPVRALARATVQGRARQCGEDDPDYAEAEGAYLSRFPDSAAMFGFSDFSLFVIEPRSIRFVGGFAQASTITAEVFAGIMGGAE